MTTLREALNAQKVEGERPCVYARPEGKTKCCGQSWRCLRSDAQVLRTSTFCRRCPQRLPVPQGDPSKFRGTIAVVMPARNEGEFPRRTLTNFYESKAPGTDLRQVVIDDGSTDKCCKDLEKIPGVTVLDSKGIPRGQGIARSRAVQLYDRGHVDAFVSVDAHEALPRPHGLERLAMSAIETGGVVGCLSGILSTGKVLGWIGLRWATQCNGVVKLATGHCYRKPIEPRGVEPAELLGGACYAFTRETYDRLGGFGECFGLYGWLERDLSVVGRFVGVPMLVDTRVVALHHYRKKRPYQMSGVWRMQGAIQCLRRAFRPDTFERVFRPYLQKVADKHKDPVIDYLLRCRWLDELSAGFEARKTVPDEEVLRWLGVPDENDDEEESRCVSTGSGSLQRR